MILKYSHFVNLTNRYLSAYYKNDQLVTSLFSILPGNNRGKSSSSLVSNRLSHSDLSLHTFVNFFLSTKCTKWQILCSLLVMKDCISTYKTSETTWNAKLWKNTSHLYRNYAFLVQFSHSKSKTEFFYFPKQKGSHS